VSTPSPNDSSSPEQRAERAARPLRWLVALSLILPLATLAVAGWLSYQQHFSDARDRLDRDLGRIYEHALKVFETFDLSARYVDQLLEGVSNEKARIDQTQFKAKLKGLIDNLPQLLDIWVVDSSGALILSGTGASTPSADLLSQNYFLEQKNKARGPFVTDVIEGGTDGRRFFAISYRRENADGAFNGVTLISVRAEYFTSFYGMLPQPAIASLIRENGAILARFPERPAPAPSKLPENSPILRAFADSPDRGFVEGVSAIDGTERTFVYHRLPETDVYVAMGLDRQTVVGDWLRDLTGHLLFGIPATIALFGISLVALRRTERAELAHARLLQEVGRRELTERALRQSQKMEAVGRLTGGIAHDFNNLLTAILGNVDLALRRIPDSDERVRRLLNSARQASERAATLVQRLLAYSRQHPLEVKAVDINKLVAGMSELLRRTIGETIAVETRLADGLWRTAIDANQLENTILNLAINSRDAMPEGGRLTIETANALLDEDYVIEHAGDVPHGQYVLIAIADSGTGMTREILDRAFEPFFTTKPTGVGTGLGLSMVYGFVKQSGGHIKIYSEPGEGTSIKIYFPRLADDSDLPVWQPTELEEAQGHDMGDLGDTILLVEDDEEVNRFATEVLREEGYNVIATHDARSALRLLDANPGIKLLFTDIILPGGMNGRQLSDEALRRRPDLKVLHATGYTRDAIIHEGRLDSDVELLNKPFTHDLLTRKVRQILDADPQKAEKQSA
jgi:two-component system NtrC family sensor kinase